LKGVSKVDMDFKRGQFTLTVKEGTTITPSAIRKAVRDKFTIPTIELVGVPGKVKTTSAGAAHFVPNGQKAHFILEEAKGKKAVSALKDGQVVAVSGILKEARDNKKKSTLVIEVSGVKSKTG